jgi:diamine N-acetyltransferase
MSTPYPKVHLRAIEPEDLDMLYRIENDVKLWNVGITNVPYSRYALHDYVANASGDIYADHQVRLIVENEQQSVVGIADIVDFDAANRRAEIGLVIEQPYRGQGYGFSAMQELARYALEVLHLHQLYAIIDVGNESCLQLFRQLGYRESAQLKDWLYDGRKYRDAIVMQTFF